MRGFLYDLAPLDGAAKGERIGVGDPGSARESESQARQADICGTKALGDVTRGGIAFKVGGERQKNLANGFGLDTLNQGRNAKLADAGLTPGGKLPHQGMIAAPEGPGGLDGVDIGGIFDHAKEGIIAIGTCAKRARIGIVRGEGSTLGTEADPLTRLLKGLHQGVKQGLGPPNKSKGGAL